MGWVFYIIQQGNCTYAGVSPDPVRRLRQHNGEIKGGAKYPLSRGPGWKHVCLIKGFPNKINAMQFEWAVKHCAPRSKGGVKARFQKLAEVLSREKWTSKSPDSASVHLSVFLSSDEYMYLFHERESVDYKSSLSSIYAASFPVKSVEEKEASKT
jgi:predicted GIY-YIG superfamily endonuclease